jgi:hypothetical protein
MTPEKEVARKKPLVSAAKALLSLQVGIGIGCVRVNKILHWLGLERDERYQIFWQFLRATGGLPIGNERLQWAHTVLLEQDDKLAKIEAEYRPEILKGCITVIEMYD